MLSFWTDAEEDTFRDVVLDSLAGLPEVEIRLIPYEEDELIFPGPNEVVVAMGAGPHSEVKKGGYVPKNRALTSCREKTFPYDNPSQSADVSVCHWMFSFSPNSIYVEAERRSQIAWDARLAHRFLTTQSLKPVYGDYSWVGTFEYVIAYIEQKYEETGKPVSVSTDLETMGLIPWLDDKKIVSISMTVEPGVADAVYLLDDEWQDEEKWAKLMQQVRWIFTSPKVALTGANLKYDIQWTWVKWNIRPTNFKMDTLLVGSILDENRSNSLKEHARQHTDMGGYELPLDEWLAKHKLGKGDMHRIPKSVMLPYAGGDTDVTQRVSIHQRKQLQLERGLQRLYVRLIHPVVRAFEAIEHRGLAVDLEKYETLRVDLEKEVASLEAQALSMMPARLKAKYADDFSLKPSVLKDFFFSELGLNLKPQMFTAKTGQPKTDKAHFMMFEDVPEAKAFLDVQKAHGSASKTLSTYVYGFLNHLRPDGFFHPTYMLFNGSAFEDKDDDGGTDTGRSSAIDPAVQTIPKHTKWAKRLRECFPAPPGYRFFQADFSQGELRIAACVAEEDSMIEAYQSGKDLHCLTGAGLGGYGYDEFIALWPEEEDEDLWTPEEKMAAKIYKDFRQKAKAGNFGLLYGMQAAGFQAYAKVNYGVEMTMEEAEGVRDAFFARYPGLVAWHNAMITFAHQHQYVVSPLGRVAHLPLIKSKIWEVKGKAERKAINSPVQSTLSDLCMWSISFLEDRYASEGLWIAGMTHDSIYGYYPEDDDQNMWLGRIVEVMQTLPYKEVFDWHPPIGFPADIETGTNLADLKTYKFV